MKSKSAFLGFLSAAKLYIGLAGLFVFGVLTSYTPSGKNVFLDVDNLSLVLGQVSVTGILAVGMTLVILTGGIDLSVGTMMALGGTLAAMLLTIHSWTWAAKLAVPVTAAAGFFVAGGLAWSITRQAGGPIRVVLSMAVGVAAAAGLWVWGAGMVPAGFGVLGVLVAVPLVTMALGGVSGVIIAKGKLQPFIVTLAMMIVALGTAKLVAGEGRSVFPLYYGVNCTQQFEVLGARLWEVVPVPGLFFLATVALCSVVLTRTRFGRYVYAIGGGEEAALLSGIKVDRIKILVYGISGFLCGLAGILFCAQYESIKPDVGTGRELDAIAAVVIGGTSLMGGRGSVTGTLVGVLIFGLLSNILVLQEVHPYWQYIIKGVIIVFAVLLQEGRLQEWLRGGTLTLKRLFSGNQ